MAFPREWSLWFKREALKEDKLRKPFYDFNYVIYPVAEDTLETVGTAPVFPSQNKGAEPYKYNTPKKLKDLGLSGPVLEADKTYYMVMRLRNQGTKVWKQDSTSDDHVALGPNISTDDVHLAGGPPTGDILGWKNGDDFVPFVNFAKKIACRNVIKDEKKRVASVCTEEGATNFHKLGQKTLVPYTPDSFGAIDINSYAGKDVGGTGISTPTGDALKQISTICRNPNMPRKQLVTLASSLNQCNYILKFMLTFLEQNDTYTQENGLWDARSALQQGLVDYSKCPADKPINKMSDLKAVFSEAGLATVVRQIWIHYEKLLKAGSSKPLWAPSLHDPCTHPGWGAPLVLGKNYPEGMFYSKVLNAPYATLGHCLDTSAPPPPKLNNKCAPVPGKSHSKCSGDSVPNYIDPDDGDEYTYNFKNYPTYATCFDHNDCNSECHQKCYWAKAADKGGMGNFNAADKKAVMKCKQECLENPAQLTYGRAADSAPAIKQEIRFDIPKLHCKKENKLSKNGTFRWVEKDINAVDITGAKIKTSMAFAGFYFRTPTLEKLKDYQTKNDDEKIPPLFSFAMDMFWPKGNKKYKFSNPSLKKFNYEVPTKQFVEWQNAKDEDEKVNHPGDIFSENERIFFHIKKKPPPPIKPPEPNSKIGEEELQVDKDIDEKDIFNTTDLFVPVWHLINIDKQDWPPYGETYFMTDHYCGPTEDGFMMGSIDALTMETMSDKFRKYTNSIWQVAKIQPGATPRMAFDVDYQIRKGIVPEGTNAEEVYNKINNRNTAKTRKILKDWIKTVTDDKTFSKDEVPWLAGKTFKSKRYPHLTDTGVKKSQPGYVEPASDFEIEDILKVEAITRKTFPHGSDYKSSDTDENLYCQHPYNTGKYSPRKKCRSYGVVTPAIKQQLTQGQKTKCKKTGCPPGYKCQSSGCIWQQDSNIAKIIKSSDYMVQISGIQPGYDFDDYKIDLPGYRTYDYKGATGLTSNEKETWITREILPGPGKLNLKVGDEIDRVIWGQSNEYQNWKPSVEVVEATLPFIKGSVDIYNEEGIDYLIKNTKEARYPMLKKNIKWSNPNPKSIGFPARPTFRLSEPPIIRTLIEIVDSMENNDNWHYDMNFTYKPWDRNRKPINSYLQEMDVEPHLIAVDKCQENILKISEASEHLLPYAYENEKYKGNPSDMGNISDCKPVKHDTSVISVSNNIIDKINKTVDFNKNATLYNEVTFDMKNDKYDTPVRSFLFSNLSEAERKAIFYHVASADHSEEEVATKTSLISEHKGSLNYGNRPYFYLSRNYSTEKITNTNVNKGIVEEDLISAWQSPTKISAATLLDDSIKETKDGWELNNIKLKKEWFRDYGELSAGKLANYEVVAYKLVKSGTKTKSKVSQGTFGAYEQTGDPIYIYPSFEKDEKKRIINYIDTQVKLGKMYEYDLYAVMLVYGTKYKYVNPQLGREYKTHEVNGEEFNVDLKDNWQAYVNDINKTPSEIHPIYSKQQVLLGAGATGAVVTTKNKNDVKLQQRIKEGQVKDWNSGPTAQGVAHKFEYVHNYAISSYVQSRPHLAIYEVPLLRRPFKK